MVVTIEELRRQTKLRVSLEELLKEAENNAKEDKTLYAKECLWHSQALERSLSEMKKQAAGIAVENAELKRKLQEANGESAGAALHTARADIEGFPSDLSTQAAPITEARTTARATAEEDLGQDMPLTLTLPHPRRHRTMQVYPHGKAPRVWLQPESPNHSRSPYPNCSPYPSRSPYPHRSPYPNRSPY